MKIMNRIVRYFVIIILSVVILQPTLYAINYYKYKYDKTINKSVHISIRYANPLSLYFIPIFGLIRGMWDWQMETFALKKVMIIYGQWQYIYETEDISPEIFDEAYIIPEGEWKVLRGKSDVLIKLPSNSHASWEI